MESCGGPTVSEKDISKGKGGGCNILYLMSAANHLPTDTPFHEKLKRVRKEVRGGCGGRLGLRLSCPCATVPEEANYRCVGGVGGKRGRMKV